MQALVLPAVLVVGVFYMLLDGGCKMDACAVKQPGDCSHNNVMQAESRAAESRAAESNEKGAWYVGWRPHLLVRLGTVRRRLAAEAACSCEPAGAHMGEGSTRYMGMLCMHCMYLLTRRHSRQHQSAGGRSSSIGTVIDTDASDSTSSLTNSSWRK